MGILLDIFRSTWKGAVWFTTALVTGVLMYSDQKHFNQDALAKISFVQEQVNEVKIQKTADSQKLNQIAEDVAFIKGKLEGR